MVRRIGHSRAPAAGAGRSGRVYVDPKSWAHYQKTGQFRDGTVFAKELVLVGSTQAVSGNGYFMGEFVGLEATIKDRDRLGGFTVQPKRVH